METGLIDLKRESHHDNTNKTSPNIEKDIFKRRSIHSKRSMVRHKDRIAGGQIQQSLLSVRIVCSMYVILI